MSNAAVRKMEDEAERGGYKAMIARMNQLTVGKNEKAETKNKKVVKKAKSKESEEKSDKKTPKGKDDSPEVTSDLKAMVQAFFHKKKPDEDEKPVNLYVGSGRKKKAATVKKKRRRPGQPRK